MNKERIGLMYNRKNNEVERRRKRRKIVVIIVLIILAIALAFGLDIFFRTRRLFNRIHQEVDTIDLRAEQNLPELALNNTPFSILILGIDSESPGDPGRSDTMMLVSVNQNERTAYLLSIARDTLMPIVGLDFDDKINHAYAFGGAGMSVNSVQNFLNIPVDFYVTLYTDGFGPLIDAMGGIRVYNDTIAFEQQGHTFPLGYINLHGDAALAFANMRMQDPQGDFGRQQRQRAVIGAMTSELTSFRTLIRYRAILSSAEDNLITDIAFTEMIRIVIGSTTALRNITDLQMRGQGQIINGIYYEIIPEYQRLEMSQRLRRHLDLE